jgi:exodeoxyribonuclease-3
MRIVTWNVNGLRAVAKKGFVQSVAALNPDFLCLQETKAHEEQLETEIESMKPMVGAFSSGFRPGYSGVATFSKKPITESKTSIGIRKFDVEGRFHILNCGGFDLYNIYFPNGSSGIERHLYKQEFLARLNQCLSESIGQKREIIVVGDYNVAPDEIDVYDPKSLAVVSGFLPEERAWFRQFYALGFKDMYRHFHGDKKNQYTWWSYQDRGRERNQGWRIDHICATPGIAAMFRSCEIRPDIEGSDHCPVVADIDVVSK